MVVQERLPKQGLVRGLAEAADRPGGRRPDEWFAIMQEVL